LTHIVTIPLGGIESDGLVRDLYDLDSWLCSGAVNSYLSLPRTHEKLWHVIRDENKALTSVICSERIYFLPESYTSSKKIWTISSKIENLPVKVLPLSETGEKEVIECLMMEINDLYALNVDTSPNLDRCSGSKAPDKSQISGGQIFIIGASHAARVAGGLAEFNLYIVNLTKPGWVADANSRSELRAKLGIHKACPGDIIVIDPISNDTFCGTDVKGNHLDPEKTNGTWHIPGQLSVRTKSYLKNTLACLKFLNEDYKDCRMIVIMPLPRYVKNGCCIDPAHVTNLAEPDFENDFNTDIEMVEGLLIAWAQNHANGQTMIHFRATADDPAASLSKLKIGGVDFWLASDPVHCIP
jgi:hypothetical protein